MNKKLKKKITHTIFDFCFIKRPKQQLNQIVNEAAVKQNSSADQNSINKVHTLNQTIKQLEKRLGELIDSFDLKHQQQQLQWFETFLQNVNLLR